MCFSWTFQIHFCCHLDWLPQFFCLQINLSFYSISMEFLQYPHPILTNMKQKVEKNILSKTLFSIFSRCWMLTLLLLGKQRHENGVIKTGSSFSPDTNSSLSLPLLKRMMETTGLFFCYVPLSGLGCSVSTQIPRCHEHWALGWTMTHAPWEAMVSLFGFSPNGHPWLSGWLAAGMSLETCGLPFYVHRRAIACQKRDLGAVEQRSSEKSFQINEVDLDGPVAEVTALLESAGHVWGLRVSGKHLLHTRSLHPGFLNSDFVRKKNERKKSIYFCDFFFFWCLCVWVPVVLVYVLNF